MLRVNLLGILTLFAFSSAAAAQFAPAFVPPNPLYQLAPYRYQFNLGTTVPTAYGRAFIGVTVPFTRAPQGFSPNFGFSNSYSWSGTAIYNSSGYVTGGTGTSYSAQREFEKAQNAAAKKWGGPDAAKKLISNQWAYEKSGALPGAEAGTLGADALLKALTPTDEIEISSGRALNQILKSIIAAEQKGAKGVSAYLSPHVLDTIRYVGGSGDAINFIRQSGRLPFPPVFDSPELRDLRVRVDEDFASLTTPVLSGKPLDNARLMIVELDLSRLESAIGPVVRNLPFDDAVEARKFLNQFKSAIRSMKGNGLTNLMNPTWSTEGTNVADLVKLMTKQNLQFGPVARGGEDAYLALHKAFVTYLFVLTQPKK